MLWKAKKEEIHLQLKKIILSVGFFHSFSASFTFELLSLKIKIQKNVENDQSTTKKPAVELYLLITPLMRL